MVRPNQIVEFSTDEKTATFLMFARSEKTVKRRVLLLNFPSLLPTVLMDGTDEFVENVQLITSGRVNRYAVKVDLNQVNQ